MQPRKRDRSQPPQHSRSPLRRLTATALSVALIISSWPILSLAALLAFDYLPKSPR